MLVGGVGLGKFDPLVDELLLLAIIIVDDVTAPDLGDGRVSVGDGT